MAVRAGLLVVAVGVVVLAGFAAPDEQLLTTVPAVTDMAAGVAFLAVGIVALPTSRRHGSLAYAAGLAWFAGNFIAPALWLHRPLLLWAALAFPTGRLPGRTARVVVGAWWAAALVPVLARSATVSLVLAAPVALLAWSLAVTSPLGVRQSVRTGASSALLVAAGLALPAVDRLLAPDRDSGVPPLVLYAGCVTAAGLVLLAGQIQTRHATDGVIELTREDPDEALAALQRELDSGGDAGTRHTLAAAIGLLTTNRDLHDELASSVAEVRASRRRLVEAAVLERQRLERQLADGAVGYLDELADVLTEVQADTELRALATRTLEELARTREDLDQLARGLHPRALADGGLGRALTELAATSPLPTHVQVPHRRLPDLVETTIWYACAEAMANLIKHSGAASARIHIRIEGDTVLALVSDDGVGGARITPRGGLAGLADRLGAVDGRLDLVSEPGAGTQLTFRVPLS